MMNKKKETPFRWQPMAHRRRFFCSWLMDKETNERGIRTLFVFMGSRAPKNDKPNPAFLIW